MRAWAIWGCRYGVAASSVALYILYVLAVIATTIYSQIHAECTYYDRSRWHVTERFYSNSA